MKNIQNVTIFGDGGSRGNPGQAAYGFAVFDDNGELLYSEGKRLGVTTNNVAEYSSVINALRWIIEHYPNINAVHFKLDSPLS